MRTHARARKSDREGHNSQLSLGHDGPADGVGLGGGEGGRGEVGGAVAHGVGGRGAGDGEAGEDGGGAGDGGHGCCVGVVLVVMD